MNKAVKTIGKISTIYSGIGIIFVGLIIFGIAIFALTNYKEYEGKVTAVISNIQKERIDSYSDDSNEEQYNYTVFVDYEVDGFEYKGIEYDSYNSSMKIGDKIEIKYDLDDPSKIQSENGKTFIFVFITLGGLVTIFGIYQTIKGFKSNKENPMYNAMKD